MKKTGKKTVILLSISFLFFIFASFIEVSAQSGCGDYPGTVSFEGGGAGGDWYSISSTGTEVDFIEDAVNRHWVCKFIDSSSLYYTSLWNPIDRNNGTVEVWMYAEQVNARFGLNISDGGADNCACLLMGNNSYFNTYNGTHYQNLTITTQYAADTWYHVRLDFNCSENTFEVFINNVSKGDSNYTGNPISMDELRFYTTNPGVGDYYIDAIGYSWDPEYDVGDNLVEVCTDDGDGDGNGGTISYNIPFGNFYVVFFSIGIGALLVHLKKKLNIK